jgi:hypothetical protein
MKQFVNLSPARSEVVRTSSDRPDVRLSAFAGKDALVVHVLNLGPGCEASLSGLPPGRWRTVTTTESSGYQEAELKAEGGAGPRKLVLPARSLTTLVQGQVGPDPSRP